jgi:hypothetical protein
MADGAAPPTGATGGRPSPQIIYIAGYGRSGSTLLERVLAAHARVEGLGEVEHLTRARDLHSASCGCGRPLADCELWGPVISALVGEFDFARVRGIQDAADAWEPGRLGAVTGHGRSGNPCARDARESAGSETGGAAAPGDDDAATADGRRGAGEYSLYDRFNARLFSEVAARLGSPTYLIDSSKTARLNALRPLSLVRAGFGVRLVHMVRDGRGCMWSYLSKGSNRLLEEGRGGASARLRFAGLRSALSWRLANGAAEAFAAAYPDSYLRLRYEDFTTDPRVELDRLGAFLGLDLSAQIADLEAGRPFPRVHQVAGNRMRSAETIRLAPDVEWERKLPGHYRVLFRLVNGKMARGYGYR